MADRSAIEWTDATWNPIRGCSRVSEGCRNCYAERVAARFSDAGQPYHGLAVRVLNYGVSAPITPRWTGEVRFIESALTLPLVWRKPRRVFVNSMSDLFHEKVPDLWIDQIFASMALAPQHTFQVLTKRPERMRDYLNAPGRYEAVLAAAGPIRHRKPGHLLNADVGISDPARFPMGWIHLGVSVEDQATAGARIPLLLQAPAAIRWVSYEPALGPADFSPWLVGEEEHGVAPGRPVGTCVRWTPPLDWLVVGGESGPGARPFDVAWARSVIAQCRAAGVPVFVKQLGAIPVASVLYAETWPAHVRLRWSGDGLGTYRIRLRDRKGSDPKEWPPDLRVREVPCR